MESVSEAGYGKIGESAKKSHKNDSRLQIFELRGTVDKVWANNAGEKEEQRRLNRSHKITTGKESIQWERFFELAPSKGTRGHRYKLFKKRKGTLGQKFFSARVVDLWNELDDSTVSVDNVTAFKKKLGTLGY